MDLKNMKTFMSNRLVSRQWKAIPKINVKETALFANATTILK